MRQRYRALAGGILGCVACGGAIGESRPDGGEGGSGGSSFLDISSSEGGHAVGQVTSTYVEPICPDAPVLAPYAECDLLGDGTECGVGGGCYPRTIKSDDLCEPEVDELWCLAAGAGQQWDSCTTHTDCAAGYLCIVMGLGTQCLKSCDPNDASTTTCPLGLFCDGISIEGIGTCY